MKYCSNCGKQINEDASFCPYCGAKQTPDSSNKPATSSGSEATPPTYNHETTFMAVGWVCAVLSIFFLHIIFGVIAVVMAVLLMRTNKKQGIVLLICSILFMVVGYFLMALFGIIIRTIGDSSFDINF